MKKRNLDGLQFLMAMELCRKDSFELIRAYDSGIKAVFTYEKVQTEPEKAELAKLKINYAYKKANEVVGIICRMQQKTGRKIIRHYMGTEEQKLDFLKDLDALFNEIYSDKINRDEDKK